MGWQPSAQKLTQLQPREIQQGERVSSTQFHATSNNFSDDGGEYPKLVFIHAAPRNAVLCEYHVVPAYDVSVQQVIENRETKQLITFKASFHQREAGIYNLIAWDCCHPSNDNLFFNTVAVFEQAVWLKPAGSTEAIEEWMRAHLK